MVLFIDIASWTLILIGVVFCLIGGYGMITLKDMYARLHAASLIETLGVGGVFAGLILQSGFSLVSAKLFLILAFIFFTSPTTTHALTRAAINHDVMPEVDSKEEIEIVRETQTNKASVEIT